jgi:hypothetical protein
LLQTVFLVPSTQNLCWHP